MPKFGPENAELFLKKLFTHLQICQKWIFNSYSGFCVWSTFYKGLGSTFFKGLDPGPGPLYKL